MDTKGPIRSNPKSAMKQSQERGDDLGIVNLTSPKTKQNIKRKAQISSPQKRGLKIGAPASESVKLPPICTKKLE